MRPGVCDLIGQPISETPVKPHLEPVVAGISRGLSHRNRTQSWDSAICRNHRYSIQAQTSSGGDLESSVVGKRHIAPNCSPTPAWLIRRNVIPVNVSTPDVQTMIADVRGFQNGILQNLARHRQVPLITLRWSKVYVDGSETCSITYARNLGRKERPNGVHRPAGWASRQSVGGA